MGRAAGLTDQDLVDLPQFEESPAYSELDKLALRLATAMTETPAEVPGELREGLLGRIGPAAFAELAATIAWENHRARLNRALDVQPSDFSVGAVCAVAVHDGRSDVTEGAGGAR